MSVSVMIALPEKEKQDKDEIISKLPNKTNFQIIRTLPKSPKFESVPYPDIWTQPELSKKFRTSNHHYLLSKLPFLWKPQNK